METLKVMPKSLSAESKHSSRENSPNRHAHNESPEVHKTVRSDDSPAQRHNNDHKLRDREESILTNENSSVADDVKDHNIMEINRDLNSSHIEDNVSFRYENVLNSTLGMGGESDTIGISSPGIIGDLEGKYSEQGSDCSSVTSDSIPLSSGKHRVIRNLRCANSKAINDVRDDYDRLKRKLDGLETLNKDVTELSMLLETERYRAERLEEQLNDLTELHQNEIENLKQAIADLEEKVQYQSDERLRDVYEIMENCQTRISKIEHLSQQQYVTVEGIDNSNARAVVVKLINVVLTVLQVILLLVATAAGITMPFLKTRSTKGLFLLYYLPALWKDAIFIPPISHKGVSVILSFTKEAILSLIGIPRILGD
ncbi:transmembrane and coiled-coil domains protein 1 isoform X9 [Aedes albopictus]|uniref:Uncharacterized protein n=1 Tax=Aedes albopictus TaxID=7160 RepID=A0ABM1ZNA8_AEDAL|nr:transmembrane and coiled-coil domains protein 1 isoform X8 [Aedes albopictus]